jgi:hypothetical protein
MHMRAYGLFVQPLSTVSTKTERNGSEVKKVLSDTFANLSGTQVTWTFCNGSQVKTSAKKGAQGERKSNCAAVLGSWPLRSSWIHAKVLISRWVKYHVNCNLLSSQKELRSLVFSSASNNYYNFSKIHFPCASNNHKNLSNISRSNAWGIYLVI